MTPSESLRSRRRRQTEREIHLVTLRLVRERGFDAVTVDAVSSEAGISPRTFFNYFPSKEAAIVHAPIELDEDDAATYVEGGPAPYSTLLTQLVAVLSASLADSPPGRDEMYDVLAAAQGHAGVLAAMLGQFEQFERRLTALVSARLNRPTDDEAARLVAALALTVLRTGFEGWAKSAPDEFERGPAAHVERVAGLARDLFDADGRAGGPP